MALILTLTPNPAIDVSTSVDHVEPVRKLRCRAGGRDPGGGGINVARVAGRLGAEAVAIYPSGGFSGRQLEELVAREGVESVVVPVQGETREDFTVLDEATREEFRFVLPGPHLADAEWMACLKALSAFDRKPAFLCASGSLPPGAPDDFYARAAQIAEMHGVKFALDTSGPALKAALGERLHLIKPNLAELRGLTGEPLEDEAARIAACRGLMARHRIEAIALTLSAEGALLVTAEAAWRARPLDIRPVSTVGAGDSFLGALIWALADKLGFEAAFRHAAAAGAAALQAHGTELCRAADVRRLLPDVIVEPVS